MGAKFYQEAEVSQFLEMPATIEVVEESLKQLSLGKADNVPRRRSRTSKFMLHDMSATLGYLGVAGWKQYTTTPVKARFLVGLYDCQSGKLLAIFEASRLGQYRTGASTAVAVKYLAAVKIEKLGLIGTGWQAETQLLAVAEVCELKQVFVYSRGEEKRNQFAEKMSNQLQIEVVPVNQVEQAVADLPLIITATTSSKPVFAGESLSAGTLICAVGSNWKQKTELDLETLRRTDHFVCDSVEASRQEAGEFYVYQTEMNFPWDQLTSIGDIITKKQIGRKNAESIVLYKSVGLATFDVALAYWLYGKAKQQPELGIELPF